MSVALTPQVLEAALEAHSPVFYPPLTGRKNDMPAAVLVPLLWRDGPRAVATVRSSHLRKHAGEVCFPGGRQEEGDADLFAAACREASEEVRILEARLLGRLSSFPLYTSDYRLEPFVAHIPDAPLHGNPDEVALILEVPLADVLALEAIDAIPWWEQGVEHLSPVFTLGEHVMYGGTANVLFELVSVAALAAGVPLPPLRTGRYEWHDLLSLPEEG